MQFTKENCDNVVSGRKTMTTRRNLPRGCAKGKWVAIQPGRGKHAVGRARVVDIAEIRFWDLATTCISQNGNVLFRGMDIKKTWFWREGFNTPHEFFECLLKLAGNKSEAGKMVTNNEKLWLIELDNFISTKEIDEVVERGE